jgi:electron transfer flavoprotein alpha subunit
MKAMNICIWVHHRDGIIDHATFGLAAEARRMIAAGGKTGAVTAVAMGNNFEDPLQGLGRYGIDCVVQFKGQAADHYHGEFYAGVLAGLLKEQDPCAFLMAHTEETADLAPRLAALNGCAVVTRAADLKLGKGGELSAVRFIANGHLMEEVCFRCPPPYLVSFLPAVLDTPEAGKDAIAQVRERELPPVSAQGLKTEIIDIIEASPENLDIAEADIVVAGGRGVGKDERFDIIHELAAALGGSVAGTRPVVDWQTLPYERQIGQTGKTVVPQLIINCGISGANEYTAGMEKSRNVVAINIDPRARIFRFADLGIVGDVHRILPLLIERLKEKKE